MSIRIDYTGRLFGKLVVESYSHSKNKQTYWKCRCECGNEKIASAPHLNKGTTISCGCHLERHNHSRKGKKSKLYRVWTGMKARCSNPNQLGYKNYGGKGVAVCERWHDFVNFRDDMEQLYKDHVSIHGEKNTTLERMDGNKGYSPDNCKWATYREQRSNTKQTVYWDFKGNKISTGELLDKHNPHGVGYPTFYSRVNMYGWSVEKALSTPVRMELSRKCYRSTQVQNLITKE